MGARPDNPMAARSRIHDGLKSRIESYVLTHFGFFWRLVQRIGPLNRWFNRLLIRRAIAKTKPRPHQYSMFADYTCWPSLTDRVYSGRHMAAATAKYCDSLPPLEAATELFRRPAGRCEMSPKSTVLFTHFAQWFTDGFLRTDHTTGDENAFRRNTSNHEIDLAQLYGLRAEQTNQLREMKGGRLKCSRFDKGEFPPLYFQPNGVEKPEFDKVKPLLPEGMSLSEERKAKMFVGGVERVNVQIGYAMFNTLFLREHNRICGELARAYNWDDERLFQTTRNIMIVILLRIVLEQYINHITPYHFKFFVDPTSFGNEAWYRTNWMTVEFNLLYRWHSMVPDTVLVDGRHLPLSASLYNNRLLVDRGLAGTLQDASSQAAAKLGLFNTYPVLVEEAERKAIELGRKAKLCGYNDYRELFSFPRVTDFEQISEREEVQRALKTLYGSVDAIELFVGLFAEDVRPGSALPALIGRMVGVDAFSQALTNPLLSTHVFNPATFSQKGWEIIHETNSLSQLLHRNLGSDRGTYRIKMTQTGDEVPPPARGDVPPPQHTMRRPHAQAEAVVAERDAAMSAGAETPERGLFVK
jgi:prostaglandin-endoperoxide synthase 2